METSQWTNYHSHCNYCDGKNAPEEYILKAIESKMMAYGFSSHAPVPFDCKWCMKKEDMDSYQKSIFELKKKYIGEIQIYCGLEIDYVPEVCGPKSEYITNLGLDYSVGSVHFVDHFPNGRLWEIDNTTTVFKEGLQTIFNGDIEAAIKRYYSLIRRMVLEETPTIVGHLDKIKMHNKEQVFFTQKEDWYQKEVKQTLDAIAESGAIIEVNTRGYYKKITKDFYPGNWALEEILHREIPITISSDAHTYDEIVLGFAETTQMLREMGFKSKMILYDDTWQKVNLV